MQTNTTPTINGLRLVSPEEAGVQSKDSRGDTLEGVVLYKDEPLFSVWRDRHGHMVNGGVACLIPLPKPRTTRPFKRGEVKCGDVFRHKETGNDYMVIGIYRNDQVWFLNEHQTYTYATLLDKWQKLVYDSEGREVLSVAGKECD